MLNRDELAQLYRELRAQRVLSVYLDGRAHDFSERKLWRKRMEHAVVEARRELNGSAPEELGAFDAALARVDEELGRYDQFLPDRGWVGFATADRLLHGQDVRVPMPDLVRWEDGIRVAPYVRALKQERPVVGALVDSRRARVFEYRGGTLQEVSDLLADGVTEDFASINQSKRATGHTGVRGKTGTDAAQWSQSVESERLMKRVVHALVERDDSSTFFVIGGVPEAIAATREQLPNGIQGRTVERFAANLEMSDAEIREILEEAASELTQSMQAQLVAEVIDQARSGGKGALGPRDVDIVLNEKRVDTLLLSRGFIASHPDHADRLVGAAFEQNAEVEELSAEGADRLDGEAQGVAARLRYVLEG